MDPTVEEQLDYEDEEYGGSQKMQYVSEAPLVESSAIASPDSDLFEGTDMDAANRLSAIAVEMGQLQNQIQWHCGVLEFRSISVRTMDAKKKEARRHDTEECIESLEKRQQALREEQVALIVCAVTRNYWKRRRLPSD